MLGLACEGIQEKAKTDPAVAARMKLLLYRVHRELYDFDRDRSTLNNVVDDPAHRDTLHDLRMRIPTEMTRSNGPLSSDFAKVIA